MCWIIRFLILFFTLNIPYILVPLVSLGVLVLFMIYPRIVIRCLFVLSNMFSWVTLMFKRDIDVTLLLDTISTRQHMLHFFWGYTILSQLRCSWNWFRSSHAYSIFWVGWVYYFIVYSTRCDRLVTTTVEHVWHYLWEKVWATWFSSYSKRLRTCSDPASWFPHCHM